jgi:hypothetical protein
MQNAILHAADGTARQVPQLRRCRVAPSRAFGDDARFDNPRSRSTTDRARQVLGSVVVAGQGDATIPLNRPDWI